MDVCSKKKLDTKNLTDNFFIILRYYVVRTVLVPYRSCSGVIKFIFLNSPIRTYRTVPYIRYTISVRYTDFKICNVGYRKCVWYIPTECNREIFIHSCFHEKFWWVFFPEIRSAHNISQFLALLRNRRVNLIEQYGKYVRTYRTYLGKNLLFQQVSTVRYRTVPVR